MWQHRRLSFWSNNTFENHLQRKKTEEEGFTGYISPSTEADRLKELFGPCSRCLCCAGSFQAERRLWMALASTASCPAAGWTFGWNGLVLLTSGERVHEWRLWQSWWGDHLLGFADLRVRFGKLKPDGLGQVGIEPHSLLQKKLVWDTSAGAPLFGQGWQERDEPG